jgi:hypothetical protein
MRGLEDADTASEPRTDRSFVALVSAAGYRVMPVSTPGFIDWPELEIFYSVADIMSAL